MTRRGHWWWRHCAGSGIAVLALCSADVAQAGEPAGACTGTDVVMLKDGGMLRGVLVAVEPERQAVIVVCGEKRTVPWRSVERVDRGGAASGREPSEPAVPAEPVEPVAKPPVAPPAPAAPSPAAAPTASAPPPPGPGVVRLHVVTEEPTVQVIRVGGTGLQVAGSTVQVGPISELICQAPCDTIIDGRDGAFFYFAGPEVAPSDAFQVLDYEGDVSVAVEPGSPGAAWGALTMTTIGVVGVIAGAILVGVSFGENSPGTGEILHISGGVCLGGGAVLTAGGIAIGEVAGTDHEFLTPTRSESATRRGLSVGGRF